MAISKTFLTPRYFEIDAYGIANHAFYVSWFESGRFGFLLDCGFDLKHLDDQKYQFVVREINITYRESVRFREKIRVETELLSIQKMIMTFKQKLFLEREKDILSAEAVVKLALLLDGKLQRSLPIEMEQKLKGG